MNLAAIALEKRPITYFAIALVVAGELFAYSELGQLEDPEFSIKTAAVTTTYPGASAEQVEMEVTDRIETKLQEMVELKCIYSNSRPGLSIIKLDIKSEHWSDRLPQVWDCCARRSRTSSRRCHPVRENPNRRRLWVRLRLSAGDQQRRVQLCRIGTLRQGNAERIERRARRSADRPLGSAGETHLPGRFHRPDHRAGPDPRADHADPAIAESGRRRRTSGLPDSASCAWR